MKRRRRSPSEERPSCSYDRRRSDYHERKNDNTNYVSDSFSFVSHRSLLDRIFFSDSEYSYKEDFWNFLKKYENVERRSKLKMSGNTEQVGSGNRNDFNKFHCVCLSLSLKLRKQVLEMEMVHDKQLTQENMVQFQNILLLYLDFKQKETFAKLYKLRQSQKNLPVAQYRSEIVSAVQNERVVIVAGDTGCGKSTQVPQFLLKAGYTKIACTQPRRIACISLCKRVAFETLSENNSDVGYQIRFEKSKNQATKILFITEGLLLRQVSTDPSLSTYDVVVLDEVHERHLYGDFLLGVVRCLLYQRPNLKVVLMSATINIKLFVQYFAGDAVVIQVPGRLYPIKLYYRPISVEEKSSKSGRINPAPYVRILQLIDEKFPKDERGDVLMFLSGMSEISTIAEAAQQYADKTQAWIVLTLHSSLSLADQDKVFDYAPEGVRKCIISTNIAETSVTIDGIRFVVDSGKMKEMSYDPICKMQRLKEFWVSRASAEQRKGRAGRTGPGICYRLYSEEEYSQMEEYSTPEIRRVPLDSLLLQMVAMGLPDARKFPFIEPPPADSLENAILSLKHHGAMDDKEKLTTIGRVLSNLPVDISLGKMLVAGSLFHQIEPVLSLAAALSVQSPFTNRAYRDPDCETSRKELESDHGDPVTLLNALRGWLEVKAERGSNSRTWCRRRGLEEQRFYEMIKLRRQFKELLQECGLLQEADMPSLSSAERSLHHGERRLLKEMQRNYKEKSIHKPRKLKLDVWRLGNEEDVKEDDVDIRDIDFRLSNDSSRLQELLSGATACSYKDLTMLKIILCGGFYPQLAIPDEFNSCKSSAEQLFHTYGKPFVALHPLSFFSHHPDVLQLQDSDVMGGDSRTPISTKHQMLCYLSLLETTKPYLVTCMRMPTLPTLLLFAQTIDTTGKFSRLVFDGWLQLEFPDAGGAGRLLVRAAHLRKKWDQLLELRLQGTGSADLEAELSHALPAFMRAELAYSVKRLLAADQKVLYIGPDCNSELLMGRNPFDHEWQPCPHEEKGGIRMTTNITYNCLYEGDEVVKEEDEEDFDCPNCGLTGMLSPIERLEHIETCQTKETTEDTNQSSGSEGYYCNICQKTLNLTPTEILRHKKHHQKKD
ncbi:probable ATP-dependent RNA helicase DHX34 isoform X1 [Schistocerca gregaria]|uniref:probable ATP-dependent RNA helicase DHX34 isoform X1 n=2 Tax=Schistocerca gregaria TaxID=7010 RepID=UPI00211DE2CC|nr:probable ATP-dependent RNA helicase DHX34 isoform X1 [Schistocerca gregaria]